MTASGVTNGTDSSNGANVVDHSNGANDFSYPEGATPYRVLKQYHSKPTKLRVACIGAGASGICLAYKMRQEKIMVPGSFELNLFEKNPVPGGTWVENTYIPAHLYTFSWDPKPDWTNYYAYGAEIRKYFDGCIERFGTAKYIKVNTKVIEGRWNEERGIWDLTLEDQATKERWTDFCHVLVNGTGILNNWVWPDIDGLHDFHGPIIHSANWDHSVDFQDKNIGVIGTGSTSVQIVPSLQPTVKSMKVFMRSSTWVSPPFGAGVLHEDLLKGSEDDSKRQYNFSQEEKDRFKNDPAFHLQFRRRIEAEINSLFGMYQQGSAMSEHFRKVITEEMLRRIGPGNEKLKEFIIPTWAPGCRRISPGDGYLEALVKPNVEPVFGPLKSVNKAGIVTADGTQHDLDIIVCATGFKVAFRPAFKLINASGQTLDEDWGDSINLYLGVSAPRFPNYYTIVGPGATWSSGTLLPSIETTVEYAVQMMKKIQHENIRSIDVQQEAVDDIYAHFDEFHKSTVFQEGCRSWFKDGKIKNRIYLWPGCTIHFLKTIKQPRYEDYNIRYRHGNRFAYLGNGEVKANVTKDINGLATYVRNTDEDWDVE
ncbi:4-hydroxyacetophenone monooxygenase [Ophiostoma piceae UAMH 11346]|uniref:4-hydroxyacetophenone monooxygenase n=1 Tax=Ophiostoma piceae (strain UAMH 11346) TaxID=1262450 RepID=S3C4F9_OPHP1|nr:4-hydroxyacetophenone monooxygenase [Ophiostoma piceae UAMH 11346]